MKGRFFAVTIVLGLAQPTAGIAGDTPWSAVKKLFHEPVVELHQKFEVFSPSGSSFAKSGGEMNATPPVPPPRPEIAIPFAAAPLPLLSRSSASAPTLGKSSTCGADLARLGVEAVAMAPLAEGRCGINEPVAVTALGGGATDLTTTAITECGLAETLAKWLRDAVQPEARITLDGEVSSLRVAASYSCRTRNGVNGAKLSEHGRGNAIDISAMRISGRGWIEIGGAHRHAEARFLETIRAAACGPFTTVLGPGADAHHSDHIHLDLAARNKDGKARGLYCK